MFCFTNWATIIQTLIKRELTVELNLNKFLDTELTNINGAYKSNVYWKNTKQPLPWTSKLPKRYKECEDESFIIPPSLFGITKPFLYIEIPYCEFNEIQSKHFLKKFLNFTNSSSRNPETYDPYLFCKR